MSINLTDTPWIDGITPHGTPHTLTLTDLLTHPRGTAALTGEPPVVAALTRLLAALLRDALGTDPITEDQWAAWWHGELPTARIHDYLIRHRDRFDLYGPRPFLQDPDLTTGAWKSIAELAPHLPSGANPVLYDHRPAALSPAETARWLISTHQYIRCGMFPGIGVPRASGCAGLLLARLVAIPTGPTVHHTLLLSLPTGPRHPHDLPPWRRDAPVLSAPPPGPVSYLTWQTRHVLLAPPDRDGLIRETRIAVDRGIDPLIPRDQQAALDPHLSFTPSDTAQDGWVITRYDPDRATWRDSAVLASSAAVQRARTAPGGHPIRIETYGLAVESIAKYVDWATTTTALPATAPGAAAAEQAAQITAGTSAALRRAATRFLTAVGRLSPGMTLAAKGAVLDAATRPFWTSLDTAATRLTTDLDAVSTTEQRDALLSGWRERTAHAAHTTVSHLAAPYGAAACAETALATALYTVRTALADLDGATP